MRLPIACAWTSKRTGTERRRLNRRRARRPTPADCRRSRRRRARRRPRWSCWIAELAFIDLHGLRAFFSAREDASSTGRQFAGGRTARQPASRSLLTVTRRRRAPEHEIAQQRTPRQSEPLTREPYSHAPPAAIAHGCDFCSRRAPWLAARRRVPCQSSCHLLRCTPGSVGELRRAGSLAHAFLAEPFVMPCRSSRWASWSFAMNSPPWARGHTRLSYRQQAGHQPPSCDD